MAQRDVKRITVRLCANIPAEAEFITRLRQIPTRRRQAWIRGLLTRTPQAEPSGAPEATPRDRGTKRTTIRVAIYLDHGVPAEKELAEVYGALDEQRRHEWLRARLLQAMRAETAHAGAAEAAAIPPAGAPNGVPHRRPEPAPRRSPAGADTKDARRQLRNLMGPLPYGGSAPDGAE